MDIMKNEKVRSILVQVNVWILRHEIISSCILTLILGLVIGGVATALNVLFV